MSACVFLGPTLPRDAAAAVLEARYLPPVEQGDLYRAVVRHRPRAIGIVDGYFQQVPSVWHKEILWAMSRGIHVFGSASMGALRAAELAAFGMRGVGKIFRAYRDGVFEPYRDAPFEDDDEVAVVHGSPESGYRALSEAMVNVRSTLAAAAEARILDTATRDALVAIAKGLYYPDRGWARLLAEAGQRGVPAGDVAALRAWLPAGRVDQKREDALAMLADMHALLAGDPPPVQPTYVFQQSDMWQRAAGVAFARCDGPEHVSDDALLDPVLDPVLDEIRLDESAHAEARQAGLWRLLALAECDRLGMVPDPASRRAAAARLRHRLGLLRRSEVDRWLADNALDRAGLDRLVEDEARLLELARVLGPAAGAHVLDHLRVSGRYAALAARARAKQRALAGAEGGGARLDEPTRFWLRAWFFGQRSGGPMPEDLEAYVAARGFPDLDAFDRAVWREYRHVTDGPAPGAAPAGPG